MIFVILVSRSWLRSSRLTISMPPEPKMLLARASVKVLYITAACSPPIPPEVFWVSGLRPTHEHLDPSIS